MIGDVVLVANKGRCRVTDVYADKGIAVNVEPYEFVPAELVSPEPLVSNDLELRGWTVGSGGWWTYKKGRCRVGWNARTMDVVVGYALLPIRVEAVHEMQHIMRLVGEDRWA